MNCLSVFDHFVRLAFKELIFYHLMMVVMSITGSLAFSIIEIYVSCRFNVSRDMSVVYSTALKCIGGRGLFAIFDIVAF